MVGIVRVGSWKNYSGFVAQGTALGYLDLLEFWE